MMLAFLAMALPSGPTAAGASLSAELQRGAAAVGMRTSDAPAVRAEEAAHPASPGFALGASLQAWRNAAGAVAYDATHVTGDGGDAALLAEACSDERIAFDKLEQRRLTTAATLNDVVSEAGAPSAVTASWFARQSIKPAACP